MKLSSRQRSFLSYFMLALSLALVGSATILSFNAIGENTMSARNANGTVVCAQPANVTAPQPLSGYVEVQLSVQTTENITHIVISRYSGNQTSVLVNATFSPRQYFSVYMTSSPASSDNNISIQIQNQSTIFLDLRFKPSSTGLIGEIFLIIGIAAFAAFFLLVEIKSRKYLFLVPVYIGLSIVYGQRFDDYFMISLGMRIFDGSNPYALTGFTPAGLQWEYPPLYAIWSYLVTVFTHYALGFRVPTNTSLNYVEVSYNNVYSAWRALSGVNLIVLYALSKLPFVISFFWINYMLVKETGRQRWKLWLINPFAVIVGIMWGQLDVLGLAFLLQAIIYHKEGKGFKPVLFASIGTAIKIFPVFVIPLLIARSKRKLLSSLAIIPVILLSLLIYAATGSLMLDLNTLVTGRAVPTYLGVYISEGLTWQIVVSDMLVRSFPSIFIYVFIPSYIVYTIYAYKHNIGLERYFITSMLLFFVTYNFMNPQYLIWIIPFFIILGEFRYAAFVSLLGSVYLYLNYTYTYFLNPDIAWNYNAGFVGQIEAVRHALTSNFVILGTFGVLSTSIFLYLLVRMLKQESKTSLETAVD
ncbi:MAG: hypothetical protein ACP5OC_03995 [Thermoplasmata archaeon]